jgi:hypothetical protein
MSIAEGKARVGDQVWQPVSAAKKTSLGIVGKSLLSPLNGCLKSEGGCAAFLVLQPTISRSDCQCRKSEDRTRTTISTAGTHLGQSLFQSLHFLLLSLGEALALRARCESGDIGVRCLNSAEGEGYGQSSS